MIIEVTQTHDVLPAADQRIYAALAERAADAILRAPGLVEFRAHRNLLGSPQVRTTTVWRSLGDWAAARENRELQALEAQFRVLTTNMRVEIWGPSPVLAEPVRAAR